MKIQRDMILDSDRTSGWTDKDRFVVIPKEEYNEIESLRYTVADLNRKLEEEIDRKDVVIRVKFCEYPSGARSFRYGYKRVGVIVLENEPKHELYPDVLASIKRAAESDLSTSAIILTQDEWKAMASEMFKRESIVSDKEAAIKRMPKWLVWLFQKKKK